MGITPQQLCADLLDVLDHVKHGTLDLAERQGLTRMQMFGLYMLDRYPDMGMSRMAEVLHCDASNVTGIVDRLVGQGLVDRQERAEDRRSKRLAVTAKGKQVIDAVMADMPSYLGCDKLSEEEREQLHVALQKFRTA